MRKNWVTVLAVAAVCSFVSGCQKKIAAKAPQAPSVQSASITPAPEGRAQPQPALTRPTRKERHHA